MAARRNTTIRDRHRTIIARGEPPCWICGQPIDYSLGWYRNERNKLVPNPRMFVAEHVIPIARGGPDTLANKAAAHWDCNREKSDKPHSDTIKRSGSLTRPGQLLTDP